MLFAIKERDVEQIISPFTWGITEAFDCIRNNWRRMCDDIEQGTLRGASDIPDELRTKLESYLRPDVQRANELRTVFSEGFDKPIAKKIWKKLDLIIAAGTGSFAVYTDRMKKYTGSVKHSSGYYLCSESVIGKEIGNGLYKLDMTSCFVEFVPIDDPSAEPVFAGSVEVGKEYTLLLTTFSGLYRYRLDDVVKIHDLVDYIPTFSIEYRLCETVCDSGVKLSGAQIYSALHKACEGLHQSLCDYAYMISEDHSLTVYAEFENDRLTDDKIINDLSDAFDEALRSLSESYDSARNEGTLKAAKVEMIEEESHLLFRDIERYRNQTAPDQIKPVRCIDTPKKEKFFKNRVICSER